MTARKVQIEFDALTLGRIEALKKAGHRATLADVVRDALALYDWCRRQTEDGFTIAAVKGERTREVVLPFEIGGPA